jgi:cysteinyl-tRNA synthetase
MLQSDESDKARRALRSMVVRLGELAQVGASDPRDSIAPFVDAMLRLRSSARDRRDFATSDLIRDELTAAGVEVKDSPSGTSWNVTT